MVGLLSLLFGPAATLIGLSWDKAIAASVATLGVFLISSLFFESDFRQAKRIAVGAGGLTLVTAAALIVWLPNEGGDVTPRPKVRAQVLSHPSNGVTTVPGCIVVTFTAAPPKGTSFAVATLIEGETRYYYEGEVVNDTSSNEWSAQVTLGDERVGPGMRFRIFILALEEELRDYLVATNPEPDNSWWSSPGRPPGSQIAAQFEVRRTASPDVTCRTG